MSSCHTCFSHLLHKFFLDIFAAFLCYHLQLFSSLRSITAWNTEIQTSSSLTHMINPLLTSHFSHLCTNMRCFRWKILGHCVNEMQLVLCAVTMALVTCSTIIIIYNNNKITAFGKLFRYIPFLCSFSLAMKLIPIWQNVHSLYCKWQHPCIFLMESHAK